MYFKSGIKMLWFNTYIFQSYEYWMRSALGIHVNNTDVTNEAWCWALILALQLWSKPWLKHVFSYRETGRHRIDEAKHLVCRAGKTNCQDTAHKNFTKHSWGNTCFKQHLLSVFNIFELVVCNNFLQDTNTILTLVALMTRSAWFRRSCGLLTHTDTQISFCIAVCSELRWPGRKKGACPEMSHSRSCWFSTTLQWLVETVSLQTWVPHVHISHRAHVSTALCVVWRGESHQRI